MKTALELLPEVKVARTAQYRPLTQQRAGVVGDEGIHFHAAESFRTRDTVARGRVILVVATVDAARREVRVRCLEQFVAVLDADEDAGDLFAGDGIGKRLRVADVVLLQLVLDELHIVRLAVVLDLVDLACLFRHLAERAFQDLGRIDA